MMEITRLSKKGQWESRWSTTEKTGLAFDPKRPFFRQTHKILSKFIPQKRDGRFLEVGAYPGKYLWYFHKYFGFEPWGVEYVESCAGEAKKMLDESGIPAHIIVDDFFNLCAEEFVKEGGWNLVASFGFVEHFDESEKVIAKHLDTTLPGGLVVVSIPNHSGWNGKIMFFADTEKWKQHNHMSLKDLVIAFDGLIENEILFSGYVGHIGFWNAGLYPKLKTKLGKLYPLVRAPLWFIERLGQWVVPNNKYTSPDILVIAKKLDSP